LYSNLILGEGFNFVLLEDNFVKQL
jgi:hypothetical protein